MLLFREKLPHPDVVKTGIRSRAELVAADKTITRIGSNSILSFDKGKRGINLQQGSVLFHSPRGRGGGLIRTAGATAAVTGTTIGVSATSNGGFKLMVLEGSAKASLPNGRSQNLRAGQLTFNMPGRNQIPKPINFDLARNLQNNQLVSGFDSPNTRSPNDTQSSTNTGNASNSENDPFSADPLPMEKIIDAVKKQERQIKSGDVAPTNFLIGDARTNDSFELKTNKIDKRIDSDETVSRFDRFLAARSEKALINDTNLERRRVF